MDLVVVLVDVLQRDDLALHADHFGDVADAARAVPAALDLDDEVQRRGDLLADGPVGRSKPAISTIVSSRASASRGALAWTVVSEPSWPVFIAWSMSSASAPRTSPMMIRSGRMRRALRTRSRMVTCPFPSVFAGRASETDHVLLVQLQLDGILDGDDPVFVRGTKLDSTLSSVVLPVPVPPETRMFMPPSTAAASTMRPDR
jgi:hypothetical protein